MEGSASVEVPALEDPHRRDQQDRDVPGPVECRHPHLRRGNRKPVDGLDFTHIGKKLKNFSGADLRAVIDMAVEEKLKQAMKEGTPRPLTTKDLLRAGAKVKASTKEWFSTARNYALYSNQGGIYDDILKYLKM